MSVDTVSSFFGNAINAGFGALTLKSVYNNIKADFSSNSNSTKGAISQYINDTNGKPNSASTLQDAIGTAMNNTMTETHNTVVSVESALNELNKSVSMIANKLETSNELLQKLVAIEKGEEPIDFRKLAMKQNRIDVERARSSWGRAVIDAWAKIRGRGRSGDPTSDISSDLQRQELIRSIPFLKNILENNGDVDSVISQIKQERSIFTKETNLSITKFIPEKLESIAEFTNIISGNYLPLAIAI